mmetsp:Transcript_70539/g.181827  ORF Transcript_70539/g.181827 Transcript_70539/m.181827 type:complete len:255 (-) Transcript_70539:550-1314(-)
MCPQPKVTSQAAMELSHDLKAVTRRSVSESLCGRALWADMEDSDVESPRRASERRHAAASGDSTCSLPVTSSSSCACDLCSEPVGKARADSTVSTADSNVSTACPSDAGSEDGTAKEGRKKRTRRGGQLATLLVATQLKKLDKVETERILNVRKINRLGFDAADLLRDHFSRFGVVEDVLLSCSQEATAADGSQKRSRQAGFCFVVMATVQEAEAALSAGSSHLVAGSEVTLVPFERRRGDSEACNVEDLDCNA